MKNFVENEKAVSEGNTLAFFLKEINRIPMLTKEEEEETALKAAEGNKAAREKLINANLRFVISIAKKYRCMGIPLEDLISEGIIGLIRAVENFDTNKKCRFLSYAVWWIRQSIFKALNDKSRMIRLPTNCSNKLIKIEKAKKFISNQPFLHSDISDEEINKIAKLLKMKTKHVKNLINISREMLSLDNSVSDDTKTTLENMLEDHRYITPEKMMEKQMMEKEIENVLSTLNNNESDIIRCRFGLKNGEPMTLQEVGKRHNLSKERIRQLEAKALRRLKSPLINKRLQEFVA